MIITENRYGHFQIHANGEHYTRNLAQQIVVAEYVAAERERRLSSVALSRLHHLIEKTHDELRSLTVEDLKAIEAAGSEGVHIGSMRLSIKRNHTRRNGQCRILTVNVHSRRIMRVRLGERASMNDLGKLDAAFIRKLLRSLRVVDFEAKCALRREELAEVGRRISAEWQAAHPVR